MSIVLFKVKIKKLGIFLKKSCLKRYIDVCDRTIFYYLEYFKMSEYFNPVK